MSGKMERDLCWHELASKCADKYINMVNRNFDIGPLALTRLSRVQPGDDNLIREAINEMKARTGHDPWDKNLDSVSDVDLVKFFR